jgi:predicted AAA+ superfamily ATPase
LLTTFEFFEDGKLFYWTREKKNANAEIDYLFQVGNSIFPIEVKAGKTGTLKSLQVYLGEKDQKTGIRFNLELPSYGENLQAGINISGIITQIEYSLLSLPLYLALHIKRLMAGEED